MHELGIVFHIADSLEKVAQENNLKQIARVTIELGEVSGVIDSYLTDCWHWTAEKSDLLRGCRMDIAAVPAVTVCESCGETYETLKYAKVCPHCGSERLRISEGDDLRVKSLEGE